MYTEWFLLTALTDFIIATNIPITTNTSCYPGLYIIVARGSDEPPGQGVQEIVSATIESQINNSASVAVEYPAALLIQDLPNTYISSVIEGISDARQKIYDYVDACGESSRIALLGYSQGGNVMSDLLAGDSIANTINAILPGEVDVNLLDLESFPLEEEYRQYIIGVALFADPRFTNYQPISAGNSTTAGGLFAREGESRVHLNSYSNVLKSYCTSGDPVCAVVGLDINIHTEEVFIFLADAVNWIVTLASQ